MQTFWQDLRYATRLLLQKPSFTLIAVLTLGLGIGANTAIFSVVNGVLLKPLPFKDSDGLVMSWFRGEEAAGGERTPLSVADVLDLREQSRSFDSVGAFQYLTVNYSGGEAPLRLRVAGVTANLFPLLGVEPVAGRTFLP